MIRPRSTPGPISIGRAVVTLALVTLLVVLAARAQIGERAALVAALDSLARAPVAEGRVAGLTVAVVRAADTLLLQGYGRADLELDVPTPADAVYAIGSVTKQFTAAMILRLAEQGKLDLDADVTRYLPTYPTHGHRVTLRRLLDHTAGIRGYTELPAFRLQVARTLSPDSLAAGFQDVPLDFPPGERMSYSNSGYIVLGMVIERVVGKPYAQAVESELFRPLGLSRTSYCSNSAVVPGQAHGYQWRTTGFVRAPYIDYSVPYSAGSLCSSARDLVAWTRALHGGRVLGPDMYREMITPDTLTDGTRIGYAKGIGINVVHGHSMIGHGGGIFGFVSELRHYPEQDLTIVVLMNSAGPESPGGLALSIADAILGRREASPVALPAEATRLAGTYTGWGRGFPLTLTVITDSAGVALRVGSGRSPTRLTHRGDLVFESGGGAQVRFLREGTEVTGLVYEGPPGVAGRFNRK